jgi:hypothetical protein
MYACNSPAVSCLSEDTGDLSEVSYTQSRCPEVRLFYAKVGEGVCYSISSVYFGLQPSCCSLYRIGELAASPGMQ